MTDKKPAQGRAAELRKGAEARLRAVDRPAGKQPESESPGGLLHELRVHQVELEMQNEELRGAMVALETSRERYFELFDLAPVGYLTLSEKGLILEVNLTAAGLLGEARSALQAQPLSRFFLPEDLGSYFQLRKRLLETGEPQAVDLQLLTRGGVVSWVRLETTVARDVDGRRLIRATLSDASKGKLVERVLQDKAAQLQVALRKLEALVALLPICAACKRIRDRDGAWRDLDAQLARSEAELPGELCEECEEKAARGGPG